MGSYSLGSYSLGICGTSVARCDTLGLWLRWGELDGYLVTECLLIDLELRVPIRFDVAHRVESTAEGAWGVAGMP